MSSSIVSKHNPPPSELPDQPINDESNPEEREKPKLVTTHVYLKPTHSTGTLEKDVVLRRLRQQRKSVSKVRTAVKALLSSPFASNPDDDKASVHQRKWADDAFAAP